MAYFDLQTLSFRFPKKKQFLNLGHQNKKGDIGMSSADPPDRFDQSAGAAHVNQPCGENFLSLA